MACSIEMDLDDPPPRWDGEPVPEELKACALKVWVNPRQLKRLTALMFRPTGPAWADIVKALED